MRFYLSLTIVALGVMNAGFVSAKSSPVSGTEKPSRGWHFYEDPELVDEEKQEVPKAQPPAAQPNDKKQPEMVEINSAWLKENLPKLLNTAIDDPSTENISNYYYAQRLAIDKANAFSDQTKEFFMFEEQLSESNRRPNSSNALFAHKVKTNKDKAKVFNSLFDKAGLWMFYRSDCPYCHQQFPAMESLAKIMGVDVLAISMDGILLDKEFPGVKHVIDPNMTLSRKFQVNITPTTMLVSNDGQHFQTIKYGMASGSELVQRALYAAKRMNLISEEQFVKTQEVKDILVSKEPLVVEKQKLEDNPSILSDLLRKRLNEINLSTTSKAQ